MANNIDRLKQKVLQAKEVSKFADTDVTQLPEEYASYLTYLTDEQLLDDPLNEEIYGKSNTDALSNKIKQVGFLAVLLVYKEEEETEKYRIIGGHRRRQGGRDAHVEKYPCFIVPPPEGLYERISRIVGDNVLSRDYNPIVIANEVKYSFIGHEDRVKTYAKKRATDPTLPEKQLDKNGRPYPDNIAECVALDLGFDETTIYKYRKLLEVIPELQEYVIDGTCSWSGIYQAHSLTEKAQKSLALAIREEVTVKGHKEIRRSWILDRIEELKHLPAGYSSSTFNPNDTRFISDIVKSQLREDASNKIVEQMTGSSNTGSVRQRTRYLTKPIKNQRDALQTLLSDSSVQVKSKEVAKTIAILEDMERSIQKKIAEIKHDNHL